MQSRMQQTMPQTTQPGSINPSDTSLYTGRAALFLIVSLFAMMAVALESAEGFIKQVSESLESALITAKEESMLKSEEHLNRIIDQHIIPHLDLRYLAKKVAGPYWKQIEEQTLEKSMEDAVLHALKRTYRVALAAYSGEKILISHSKEYSQYSLVRVQVKTENKTHSLDFAMRQQNASWSVFDVSVDGIVFSKTLHNSLQSQFETKSPSAVISALRGES